MNLVASIIGKGLDRYGSEQKGLLITETLIRQQLADDALRQSYHENRDHIDLWAQHINFANIAEAMAGGDGSGGGSGWQETAGTLLLGAAAGYVAAKLL